MSQAHAESARRVTARIKGSGGAMNPPKYGSRASGHGSNERQSPRGDCPNFEPCDRLVGPFVAAFLQPPPPYLIRAGQILRESA